MIIMDLYLKPFNYVMHFMELGNRRFYIIVLSHPILACFKTILDIQSFVLSKLFVATCLWEQQQGDNAIMNIWWFIHSSWMKAQVMWPNVHRYLSGRINIGSDPHQVYSMEFSYEYLFDQVVLRPDIFGLGPGDFCILVRSNATS